jgi:hypothetical protein
MPVFMNWIDLAWIVIALLVAQGRYRVFCVIFVLICAAMLRLQVKLMDAIGYTKGILQWIDTPILFRGMMAYSVFIAVFLGLVSLSKNHNAYVFMAAGITIFTIAFCVSSAVMVL